MSAFQYALLSASHILCLGMFVGATLAMDLGHLRAPGFAWTLTVEDPLRRVAIHTFLCTVATGAALLMVRPSDYFQNPVFVAKVFAILLAVGNALAFQRTEQRSIRKALAGLSLVLWLSVLFAGRWIGFSG